MQNLNNISENLNKENSDLNLQNYCFCDYNTAMNHSVCMQNTPVIFLTLEQFSQIYLQKVRII